MLLLKKLCISGFALKTKYGTGKSDLENKISDAGKKIPDTGKLVKKKYYNAEISEIKNKKIPNITGLATTSTLSAVENKITDVSNLVRKTDYDTKISEIEKKVTDHDQYITTPEFNKLTAENFSAN